ncbi:MAG TPA: winged helix-turn-helix domain-containing protein [Candidatus Acidoferrum sp.]|nr:winged helix-turn-helix domain-containing protein [Candidatus Acidoferrum sp.]
MNLQTGELRKQGQKLKLQEQPFQVLAALLERPGEVVTREELRRKLWPSDTFVDFDHSLNAAIKRLRDVLDDCAETPIFVETLARRGYRFIAPVNGFSDPGRVQTATALKRSKSFVLNHWVAIAVLSPVVTGVLVWALWRYPWRQPEIIERKLTLNSAENSVSGAAISRDHRYLAYTDTTGVYVKLIHTGETHLLPVPPNFSARVDDWFPDGSHLLVSCVEQTGKTSLWSISLFGGSPRHLADDASGGSVSPDGSHIAFRRGTLAYEGVWGREEWVMRSDGTDQVKVAADKSDGSEIGAPTWSPDGKRIAYIRSIWAYNARRRSLEVNEWQSKSAQTIFSDDHLSDVVHWLSDGRLVYALGNVKTSSRQDSILWVASLEPSGKISG